MDDTITAMTARDIMSRDVITLNPDMTLREAIGVLDAHAISGAPVVAAGELLGVLSASDLLTFEAATPGVPTEDETRAPEPVTGADQPRAEATGPVSSYFVDLWDNAGADVLQRIRTTSSPEWDTLSEHVVSEAMSNGVLAVQADMTLPDVADYMLEHRIHRVLVSDGTALAGVVSALDFLRAIARRGRQAKGPAPARAARPAHPRPAHRRKTPAGD
jgi:CBS domain-containing protein